MRNNFLRTLLLCVPLLGTGCSDVNPPTIPYPGIAPTAVTSSSVSLFWNKAEDSISDPSELVYKVYMSGPNPAYQSFDTISEVEAGTLVATLTDASSITISSGISAGNAYYFNIVVLDGEQNKALYDPMGEYFHDSLISYYPFSGNWNDVVTATANHLLVDSSGLVTTAPTVTLDRFAHAGSAYFFTPFYAPTTPQCLQSTAMMSTVGLVGNASRSVSFWVQSYNTPAGTAGAPVAWGDGSADSANFGAIESGIGTNWTVWLGGSADVSTATPVTTAWEHWVIGYDSATDLVYTYKNGVAVNIGTAPAVAANTVDTLLYVGCGLSAGIISSPYLGTIDDVRVYNQLLSNTEVANLYEWTRP